MAFGLFLVWCLSLSLLQLSDSLSEYFNETDRLALIAFKGRISNDPFGALTSWNESLHHCQWKGVSCSRRHTQRVTSLDLTEQRLEGSIASSIGNLTFLRELLLPINNFHGEIPQEIGRLFRLKYLNLNENSLQGQIPANLSHCSVLESIYLEKNTLEGKIPIELGSMQKLKNLSLDDNKLTGNIPPSIGNLSALLGFSLLTNNLEGSIPSDLGRMKNLVSLFLSENNFTGMFPRFLYNLSSLVEFSSSSNQLHGTLPSLLGQSLPPNLRGLILGTNQFTGSIPVSLVNASRLERIAFEWNKFSGPVPTNLGSLHGLRVLHLDNNHLGSSEGDNLGFLTSLSNCSRLEILQLSSNSFSGAIPTSVGNLSSQLRKLTLKSTGIFGSIPTEIGNLINLNTLDLANNYLTGDIPASIGKLQNLEGLFLQKNIFSGKIPSSLGNLTRLIKIEMGGNDLQGSIPSNLANCPRLQVLYLYENKLNGTIPKEIFGITSLVYLYVDNNHLTGPLPLEIGDLKLLQYFAVSTNILNGEIPSTLGNCFSLVYLYMDANYFQGVIPPSLSGLKLLQILDLSKNYLTGQIPKYLGTLSSLQVLNLELNDFYGELPKEGIFNNESAIFITGNKRLCGGIPKLQLPTCSVNEHRRKRSLRIVIPIVCAVLFSIFLCCFGCFNRYLMSKSRKKPNSTSLEEKQHLLVSYMELHKATSGFSSTNLIGVGSYGSVYKGILEHDEKIVAVKVLNLQQRGASKSFMAECEALRSIRHRNLVKIITACSSIDFKGDDFKALVFECMSNGSLDTWLHPDVDEQHQIKNLNLIQRLNVAIDVANALEYLHHHCNTPVVHRDLKPSNVLLDEDMSAHVGDFGLARILSEDNNDRAQHHTGSSVLKGTIGYIAPEYGIGGDVSTHADVYSYGILLLEMITGKRPTDDMFKDSFSLHQLAKMALSEHVMEIVDPRLFSEEVEVTNINENNKNLRNRMHECLVSLVNIGISCSAKSPKDRMEMRDVVGKLHTIRESYHMV